MDRCDFCKKYVRVETISLYPTETVICEECMEEQLIKEINEN